jgi:hypothetical protein
VASVAARIGVRLVVDVSPNVPFLGEALVSGAAMTVGVVERAGFRAMVCDHAGHVHDLPGRVQKTQEEVRVLDSLERLVPRNNRKHFASKKTEIANDLGVVTLVAADRAGSSRDGVVVHKSILDRHYELVRVRVYAFVEPRTPGDTERSVSFQHLNERLDPCLAREDEIIVEKQQVRAGGGLDESVTSSGDTDVEREQQDLVSGSREVRVVFSHSFIGIPVVGDDQMGIRISGQDRSYETTNTVGPQERLD